MMQVYVLAVVGVGVAQYVCVHVGRQVPFATHFLGYFLHKSGIMFS